MISIKFEIKKNNGSFNGENFVFTCIKIEFIGLCRYLTWRYFLQSKYMSEVRRFSGIFLGKNPKNILNTDDIYEKFEKYKNW